MDNNRSVRPDGSVRPPLKRPRPGYTPPEEVERYVAPRPQRFQGTIIDWSAKLGYGFIRPDDLSPNVFCHQTDLIGARELEALDIVEFERRAAKQGESSDRALNVRRLGTTVSLVAKSVDGGNARSNAAGGGSSSGTDVSCNASTAQVTDSGAAPAEKTAKRSPVSLVPRSVVAAKARAAAQPGSSAAAIGRRRNQRQQPEAGVLGWT